MQSFVQILSEIIQDKRISATEFRLYSALMDFGFKSNRGYSQAGHDFLARHIGVHPQTIAKALKNLAEHGYIRVERVGFTRNDKIFCLRTVKKETDKKPAVNKYRKNKGPSIIDRTNKRVIEGGQPAIDVDNSKNGVLNKPKEPDRKIDHHETEACHRRLQQEITPKSYDTWLKGLEVAECSDNNLKIRLDGSFISYDWVERHYLTRMQEILGKKVQLIR